MQNIGTHLLHIIHVLKFELVSFATILLPVEVSRNLLNELQKV